MNKKIATLVFSLLILIPLAGMADWLNWVHYGTVRTPEINEEQRTIAIIRMAIDSTGRLYLSDNRGDTKVIWYTDNPLAYEPEYEVFFEPDVELANGMQGLAVCDNDNVYVVGDTDSTELQRYVFKFDRDGEELWRQVIDDARGSGGDLLSTGEFVSIQHQGVCYVHDPDDGTYSGPYEIGFGNFTRDISIRQSDDAIFGIQSGAVRKATGGSAADFEAYTVVDFGEADYGNTETAIRPSLFYYEEENVVISTNYDVDVEDDPFAASGDKGRVFIQDADTGELLQEIDAPFDPDTYNPGAVIIISDNGGDYLMVSGSSTHMQLYTPMPTSASSWTLFY